MILRDLTGLAHLKMKEMRLGAAVAALAGLVTLVTADTGRNRATWVWDAAPLLRSPAAQEEFLTFAAEQRIGRAWIQVSTNPSRALGDADQWRAFLTRAHASGLAIDALDGAPDYVLSRRRVALRCAAFNSATASSSSPGVASRTSASAPRIDVSGVRSS